MKIKNIISFIFATLFFVVCAVTIVVYASGYKIDFKNRSFEATSLIEVESSDSNDQIYVDGKSVGSGKQIVRDLNPGTHQVEVKKEGYFSFSKKVDLKGGEAKILNGIVLFKQNPEVIDSDLNIDTNAILKLADTKNLGVLGNEIYQNNQFVTRTAGEIFGISWYSYQNYISFTYDNKLKIISIDGSNSVELLDKSSKTPAIFVNSGRTVVFENDNKVYRAEIR